MQPDDDRTWLTQEWLRKANEDVQMMNRALDPPRLDDGAAFHAQQATEKAFKGFLNWHSRPFRKTHNLIELVQQCIELDPDFDRFTVLSRRLTAYAVQTRYPDVEAEPDPQAVDYFSQAAGEVIKFVLFRLPPAVHPDADPG